MYLVIDSNTIDQFRNALIALKMGDEGSAINALEKGLTSVEMDAFVLENAKIKINKSN